MTLLSIALRPNRIRWYAVCMEPVIAHLRVSTQRQQRSGLGIEAQHSTIQQFVANESLAISAEFVEFESGKGADALDRRPQLASALAAAKVREMQRSSCRVGRAGMKKHPAALTQFDGHRQLNGTPTAESRLPTV